MDLQLDVFVHQEITRVFCAPRDKTNFVHQKMKRILCMGESKEMPRTSVVDVFPNGHQSSPASALL